jgi:hypothetical protein
MLTIQDIEEFQMGFRKFGRAIALVSLATLSTNAVAFDIQSAAGFWWESEFAATPQNRGWGIEYLPTGPEAGVVFIAGYVYDDEGNATWVAGASGTVYDGEFEVDIPLLAYSGGTFGPGTAMPAGDSWGNVNIVFNTCNSADFTFTGGADFTQTFDAFRTVVDANGKDFDACVYQDEFAGCPAWAQDLGNRACGVGGTISQDITFTNDTTWVLTSAVFIGEKADEGDPVPVGPTLTIEPGTRIIGTKAGRVALIISRGSRIIAEGLPHAPIVMTGEQWEGTGASSTDWGGLVINGAAPLNTCDAELCEADAEGGAGFYGGIDPHDSSGVLRYVRVQFAGDSITDEDQLNGIAFNGVGDGTVVDYIQVHRNADDGVEFFGGTVNAKHLVLTDIEDDSVDWTQGWVGHLQYVLVRQAPDASVDADYGMELDNLSGNFNAMPRSGGIMANFTLIGKPGKTGILARRGTAGNFSNFIVADFANCLDIDDEATFTAAGSPGNPTGVLTFQNSIFDCGNAFVEEDGDPWSIEDFVLQQENNSVGSSMLDGIFPAGNADYLSGFPLDRTYYNASFFEQVDYIGAFRSKASAWIWNWTDFLGL